jgi:hypothetical protein
VLSSSTGLGAGGVHRGKLDALTERMLADCAVHAWFMTQIIALCQDEEDVMDFGLDDLREFVTVRLAFAASYMTGSNGTAPSALTRAGAVSRHPAHFDGQWLDPRKRALQVRRA